MDAIGKEDVYSDSTYGSTTDQLVAKSCVLELELEKTPTAMLRVFGVMANLSIFPDRCKSTSTDQSIVVHLEFESLGVAVADRLMRKYGALTETIHTSCISGRVQ